MKTKLDRLVKEATESAKFREHRLQWSFDTANGKAYGACAYCDCEVLCLTNPMPNEIDIGGSAVAINCGT